MRPELIQVAKPWYFSKMVLVNIITLLVALLGVVAGSELIKDYPQLIAGLMAVIAALNVWLRFITNQPIG